MSNNWVYINMHDPLRIIYLTSHDLLYFDTADIVWYLYDMTVFASAGTRWPAFVQKLPLPWDQNTRFLFLWRLSVTRIKQFSIFEKNWLNPHNILHHSAIKIWQERDLVMREFRSGSSRILISTDLLARGIDVQQARIPTWMPATHIDS